MTTLSTPFHLSPVRAPRTVDQSAFIDVHPPSCKTINLTAHGEARKATQTTTDNLYTLVAAIQLKLTFYRVLRIRDHAHVNNAATERLAKSWKEKFAISVLYTAHKQTNLNILSHFQFLWDGHLGQITMAKHCIELLRPDTATIHPAPYWAVPETPKFRKAEIKKMLAKNIIEPRTSRMDRTESICPEKDGTIRFCVDYCKLNAVT